MPQYQAVEDFLTGTNAPVIDVRSPIEFRRGHIPGAFHLPLFSDAQRVEVGTLYRQQGRAASIVRALQMIAPRLESLAAAASQISVDRQLRVHCWRGGMRSRSTAWLFEKVDLQPTVLEGGYKSYRRHVLDSFKRPLHWVVLSGLTGSGKTRQLEILRNLGEQVIDLERLANHRGSAFGGIGLGDQPTVEHFENKLYDAIQRLDPLRVIWVEDESRNIGNIRLPHHFFCQLRAAPAVFMVCDRETRSELIHAEYGELPREQLLAATLRIRKRMGGQATNLAVAAIEAGDIRTGVDLLLEYYDRLYLQNRAKMDRRTFIDLRVEDPVSVETGLRLIELAKCRFVAGQKTIEN